MALISSGNQADKVAVGTDLQRPTSPVEGQVRFNTDEECLEVYGIFNGVGDWKCTGGSVCHVLPPDPALLPAYDDNEQGDLWYNTEDGKLYVWYDDGVGPPNAQWVDASPKSRLGQEKRFGIIGEIVAFGGTIVPDGWLECNGQSAPSDLAVVLGVANVPDLRGEFIRGWDHGRGVDSGRALLSNQGDAFKSHRHTVGLSGTARQGIGAATPQWSVGTHDMWSSYAGDGETRPRNVAMMYIIYAGES